MNRRLAVVLPCKNDLEGLRATWNALLPYRPYLEIALLDGGSTDGTTEALLAGEFEADHIVIGVDTGIYDAMNRGWARTQAPWVWFLGAGDLPDPAGIEAVVALPEGRDRLQIFRVDLMEPREPGVPDHYPARWDDSLVWRHTTHHQGVVYPRNLLPHPPFDTSLRVLGDYSLHLGLFGAGVQADLHPQRLCSVRAGGKSRTFHAGLYREEWRMKRTRLKGARRLCQPVWLAGKYAFKRIRLR